MATASEQIGHVERADWRRRLESTGRDIVRYGLVTVLLWAGALKFAADTPEIISLLLTISNGPLASWVYSWMSAEGFAVAIGGSEIFLALLIAARPFAPMVSAAGSLGAVLLFLIALGFALGQPGDGVPFPSPETVPLLARDIMLLGAAIWTGGEALLATR